MSRLSIWTEYLSNEFGLTAKFVDPNSSYWCKTPYWSGNIPFGVYIRGENLALIRKELWGKGKGFEVLIHEFGHHLVHHKQLTYKANLFVADYFRKVSRPWLLSYNQRDREEEMIVQCLALWALDWGDNYEVNKGFKDFLISLGASPPPF
jgi:hypothetical protein